MPYATLNTVYVAVNTGEISSMNGYNSYSNSLERVRLVSQDVHTSIASNGQASDQIN